ncbi:Gfo/Idh/MocA family protein [Kiloniella majae]|uniref:Gfo/Idh/MocA family protein n=1 Tax=Kiloniella majae TaxID=1938558 RepID=UPI000A279766|nr:Gfo/Idh/MocA family oxidoreductase [Kiloniella majae]
MRPLKAGVIGLGVGEQHLISMLEAGIEVSSLCDFDPEKRTYAKSKYPNCRLYENANDLIDDPELDIVAIASYDHHHTSQIVRALENGKHVFAEKPVCLKQEEAEKIKNALARSNGLRLSTNTILRLSPRFLDLKRRCDSGELGSVYNIEADYNYGRLHKIMSGWRGEIEDYSVMLGGGIHLIDLMLWISGQKIVEVHAIGNKICSSNAKFHTPDMATALLRFDNSIIGKVSANFGCVMPHFHKFCVYGTKATFENQVPHARLYTSREADSSPQEIDTPYPAVQKGALIPSFIQAIRGNGDPIVSEADVFSALDICFAIDRSLQTGKPEIIKAT